MPIVPKDNQHYMQALQNDAQQMRTFISWLQERNITYQQQFLVQNLAAAGITGPDQNDVLAFIADVSRLVSFVQGTPQEIAGDIRVDITKILGAL